MTEDETLYDWRSLEREDLRGIEILENLGWRKAYTQGSRVYLRRPIPAPSVTIR